MGYILYFLTFFFFVLFTGLYFTRAHWLPHLSLPPSIHYRLPDYIYTRLPSSFESDIESGFSSADFDLSANVADGDSRAGLDQRAKRQVQRIMWTHNVGFDEARRIWMEERFEREGIGADGRPRDPKAVTFDRL